MSAAELADCRTNALGKAVPVAAYFVREGRPTATQDPGTYSFDVVDQYKRSYAEWRAAEEKARALEKELQKAWDQCLARNSDPPPEELMQSVWSLRAEANEKLTIAVRALRSVPRSDTASSGGKRKLPPDRAGKERPQSR